jgi:hypothetical protein
MAKQKFDEVIHRLGLQVELRGIGADCGKALRRPRVLNLRRKKVQEDEVDMLNFIGASRCEGFLHQQ